jgi:ribosomal protein L11 methylase PrmA
MATESGQQHPASYRDPCGFVFQHSGTVYRAVLPAGKADYEMLMQSGLYQKLVDTGLMIGHEELQDTALQSGAYKILKPQQLSFWTYPYEWSFHQLKDAALLTLKLITTGLKHGMMLKDANSYNIQFVGGKPMLIDSLSFETYEEGQPWQAFNQFCQHFLYPLLVFQKCPELSPAMLMAYPDGLTASLTVSLLPWSSRISWNNQLYVYLAAAVGEKQGRAKTAYRISKQKILQNVAQLKGYIQGLEPKKEKTAWNNYYGETILSDAYLENKKTVVAEVLKGLRPERIVDAGCNTGAFSFIAASAASEVIAFDFDAASIDMLYLQARQRGIANLQMLVADITNPSPALGWHNAERSSLKERLEDADMVLALALVHHLALAKNIPLSFISSFFASLTGKWLLIEFVPKSDPKAQLLLQSRRDIFEGYTKEHFEAVLRQEFTIEREIQLLHSDRVLYLLKKI